MMYERTLQKIIEAVFFRGRAVILYGARRVGKTTLIRCIQSVSREDAIYFNCDEPDIRLQFTDATSSSLSQLIGTKKLILIDEAQRVKNIGITLKLLVDNFPGVQVVATGSSSLDLSNEIVEPLTGRKYEFHLHPFSIQELRQEYSVLELDRTLEQRMVFGMYPEVEQRPDESEVILRELSTSYLYKDVLQYQDIRRPELLEKLLLALALQIGNEVSFNELAVTLGVSKQTVANYMDLLEKAFVIFRLPSFSRNLRTELSKSRKFYFYDTGIRNALINNFNPLTMRVDAGALWENYMISERLKFTMNEGKIVNRYFWRTYQQQEIDYIEEIGGKLSAFEIKWKKRRTQVPKPFAEAYPDSSYELVHRHHYHPFVGL
jgi:predicted AAA+ superfamily ATPase